MLLIYTKLYIYTKVHKSVSKRHKQSNVTGCTVSRATRLSTKKKLNSVVFSPQANYTDREIDRRLLAKLVPTFADRACRVVSATDHSGR
jgi:hypothetical protein